MYSIPCNKNTGKFSSKYGLLLLTKLIPVLIHLKYWYYDSLYLELPCLLHHLYQVYPSLEKPLFNTIFIMFFIGFTILSYPIQPHATINIGYTKTYGKPSQSNLLSSCLQIIIPYGSSYPSKSWVFNSRFSLKVRQHSQQQLYFQCRVCWIAYGMIGAPSFSQPFQPPQQSPKKPLCSTSANFHLPFSPLLFISYNPH